ncbi:MAG TPA: tRNA glutamyl-Q(34) synthetase GluQRS [Planctomycetota bacterium]|nr:tRNA glutamyl-Q(34) synthetase GluQRS [Planctomycetota bacterium]
MIISRLAPSPTGVLHLGNVRTFLWAWLSARSQGGRMIMRIEDLETRARPGVIEKILDDLAWMGFDWDEGPRYDASSSTMVNMCATGGSAIVGQTSYIQSERRTYYETIHDKLLRSNAIYPCVCTRADIAAAQSAPHEGDVEPRYPGTCRGRFANAAEAEAFAGKPPAWRLNVTPGEIAFSDLLYGAQRIDVQASVGDVVIAKAPDNPAYQLAVVADDIAMGVTEVVRGDDLIPSTARQILIYQALGERLPRYGHVPLVVGPDGKRLAKRHGDARIASFRERGVKPERIIGTLARWSGLPCDADAMPRDLLPLWSWKNVSRERVILTPQKLAELN